MGTGLRTRSCPRNLSLMRWGKGGSMGCGAGVAWTGMGSGRTIGRMSRRARRRDPCILEGHAQPRFYPSQRPLVLFAAAWRDHDRQARRARQEGPPAGAGADRHRQHVRGAGILRQGRGLRHPADRRLCAGGRFRRPGTGLALGPGPAVAPHPAGGARGGLPQPDAAQLARLSRDADASGAAYQA